MGAAAHGLEASSPSRILSSCRGWRDEGSGNGVPQDPTLPVPGCESPGEGAWGWGVKGAVGSCYPGLPLLIP